MQANENRWRLAVLVSGSGRTLENLLQVIARGKLPAEVVVVVSSMADVRALRIAADAGIPTHVLARRDANGVQAYSAAMYTLLAPYRVDLVVMAGFLRQLLVHPRWEHRILNIHPALLPQAQSYAAGKGFYGDRVHAAVLAHGDAESGATVHVVTDVYDDGPPLAQAVVPVLPTDDVHDLADRVFAAERELYPRAIAAYIAAHPELRSGRN